VGESCSGGRDASTVEWVGRLLLRCVIGAPAKWDQVVEAIASRYPKYTNFAHES